MLNIKNITLRNFLSTGQITQTITFSNGSTQLILGENKDYGDGVRNGVGKAQPLTSKVKTPTGWKTMGDIYVGDIVCTPYGTHTVVVGKYPQGKKPIYELTMSDGRKTKACPEHLWSVKDAMGYTTVISTQEIIKRKKEGKKVFIENLDEVYQKDGIMDIDPYTLGCLMASGDMKNGYMVFSNLDQRIIDMIAYKTDYEIMTSGFQTFVSTGNSVKTFDSLLKDMGIEGECRVPDNILHGSLKHREEFLKGVFDCLAEKHNKNVSFYLSSNKMQLSKDIKDLIRSIGGMCTSRYVVYSIKDKEYGLGPVDSQRDIVMDCVFRNANNYFYIEEKKDYLIREKLHYEVKSIVKEEEQESACIKLLDERSLYITDDYITTHNTTIINALSYALYGNVVSGIKKQDSIVNNKNSKNMLVTCEFSVDDKEYRIERGRKPNVLNFYRYDEGSEIDVLKSLGENKNTQEIINNILGISEKLFQQIILMNTYSSSFMGSGAAKQREIIEEILGIELLSRKAENLSEKLKEAKKEFDRETIRIETVIDANKRIERNIEQLKNNLEKWDNDKETTIKEMTQQLEKLKEIDIDTEISNHEKNKEIDDLKTKVDYLKKEYNNIKKLRSKSSSTLYELNDKLEAFNNNVCYACNQPLNEGDHDVQKEKIEQDIKDTIKEIDDYDSKLKEYDSVLNQIDLPESKSETFYKSLEDAYNHKSMISNIEEKIEEKRKEENPYKDQIEELEKGENGIQEVDYEKYNQVEKEVKHYKFLQKLLINRDSFIRKRIIDQSLPYLNKRLPIYLDELDLPHHIEFDSDLTFSIQDRGTEIDFGNLSRGEQNRTIFALNLAFRDLFENLVGPINILFVDELLDFGIDTVGAIKGLGVLNRLSRDKGKSVYLISHKDELQEFVEHIIYVKKENGFTTFDQSDSQ